MRRFVSFLSLILGFQTAQAVELEQATNQQLLRELSRRLSNSGNSQEGSIAIFSCTYDNYILISLTNSEGVEKTEKVYLGSSCTEQAEKISKYREINRTTIIALCTYDNYLLRYSLLSSGVVKNTSKTYIGSSCRAQADQINN